MSFAGVQLTERETPHEVVYLVMNVAVGLGLPFRRLETLGTFGVGPIDFLRFKTDLTTMALGKVMSSLQEAGRGVVYSDKGTYFAALPGGRRGSVAANKIQAVALPGMKRTYKGPAVQFWGRQFMDLK